MKLSTREKNMIIVFGIALICVAIYFFVVEPIHVEYKTVKAEYDTVESQYRIVKTQVKDDNEMEAIMADYRDRLARLNAKLPSQVYLEKIIDDMYNHFGSYEIVMDAVTFNLVESEQVEVESIESQDGLAVENLRPVMSVEEIMESYEAEEDLSGVVVLNEETIAYDYSQLGYMNVNMSFTANYNIFKDALSSLALLDSTVIPTNLSLSKSEYDDEARNPDDNQVFVALSVAIPFYYDNEEKEDIFFDYEFEPEKDFEEHGPFEYVSVTNSTRGSSSSSSDYRPASTVTSVNADFTVSIRNSSSDLAAQSLTYSNIPGSKLELDSNRNEKYIMDITESGSSLSFKYSNDNATYPSGSAYEVLSPKGDNIVVKVNSSVRSNLDDDSGLTLVLNNRSSRKVMIYVSDDDPNNPRFNIIVNAGAFEVIRN
ncbi:hypothetical protein EZV73_14510 [Acidaminobacter sp. JC074]|uniref:type II secretion system protein GspM n=1 Tax=Acidaminobacter sp. JC074 TaxID=2530199 RepID=UPI001F0D4018|nr:type II secretion system protein GspM [Acidaminobacter sp. JC074]MCH4888804.1 hypothetical protein [Acidaminobacter sp. JC074]